MFPADETDSPEGFAAWVARLAAESGSVRAPGADQCCEYRWIVEDGRVLGGIAFRYGTSDYVRQFGHFGYGVRPSARRRGLAGWALVRMLDDARALGLDRVVLICLPDNIASARTIERAGAVFEGIRDTEHGPVRRYSMSLVP